MSTGLGVVVFSTGLVFYAILAPARGTVRTPTEEMMLLGSSFGALLLGSFLLAVGIFARIIRDGMFRMRCPKCRHRVKTEDDVCPECFAKLSIDARTHFVVLSKVGPNIDGSCPHCGAEVRAARVMNLDEPIPGQYKCEYCGNLGQK